MQNIFTISCEVVPQCVTEVDLLFRRDIPSTSRTDFHALDLAFTFTLLSLCLQLIRCLIGLSTISKASCATQAGVESV